MLKKLGTIFWLYIMVMGTICQPNWTPNSWMIRFILAVRCGSDNENSHDSNRIFSFTIYNTTVFLVYIYKLKSE